MAKMFTKEDFPKYIINEITSGQLVEREEENYELEDHIPGFELYTFRLYEILGDEDTKPRDISKTIALAEKIVAWCNRKMEGTATLGEVHKAWYKETVQTRYGVHTRIIKLRFVTIGITDPFNRLIEIIMEKVKSPYRKAICVKDAKLIPTPLFDTDNSTKKFGYLRCYQDKGYNWNTRWFGNDGDTSLDGHYVKATDEEIREINQISDRIFKAFPSGTWDISEYCEKHNAEKISENEYNMYYIGKYFNYWFRFRTASHFGDYSIYMHTYRK